MDPSAAEIAFSRLGRTLHYSASCAPSLPFLQDVDADTQIVYQTVAFRATLIVVGVIVLLMICLTRWDSIYRCIFHRSRGGGEDDHDHDHDLRAPPDVGLESNVKIREGLMEEVMGWKGSSTSGKGGTFGRDCSICLSEFVEGEMIRVLPNCCHPFHLPCIKLWLLDNASCPTCRNNLNVTVQNSSPEAMIRSDQEACI